MPKGPRGERRPGDTIGAAIRVARIATGEESDDPTPTPAEGAEPTAAEMGKKGGKARAASLTPERRAEIAKKAAEKRWKK